MSLKCRYRKNTDTVGLDDAHIMAIDPKVEPGKRAGVHDAESIRLSRLKWQCRVLVKTDMGSYRRRICA